MEKTEVIPIGTEEYRRRLVETRQIGETDEAIPASIHIAQDGDATRLLGAWIGNNVNPEEPWRKIVETIKKDFRRWEARYPTLEGKRHIVQMIAGGKTQFLTRAQGMPGPVQKEIQKAITEFIWGKERATICIENVARSIGQGGRKIMDIATRNEAIDLMWVKQYLKMGADRPKWAYMMDEIFRGERPKGAKEPHQAIANWNPLTQGWKPRARSGNIPKRIQNALRLAEKHGVELEALRPSEETKGEMPVWLHRKANRDAARIYTTGAAKCLKLKHCTHYMRQLVKMVEEIPDEHRKTNFCTCESCREASRLGCTHPERCLDTARKLIGTIDPKWRPGTQQSDTNGAERSEATTTGGQHGRVIVDATRGTTDLQHSIRIFTDRGGMEETIAPQTTEDGALPDGDLVVYTDGSCIGNGTADARAGSGVWYGDNDPRNTAIRVPGRKQSNQIGELLAVLYVVQNTPGNQPLRICSDSKFAIEGLTKYARRWEAKDWIGVAHGQLFKCTTAWLRARTGHTTLQWVKGHARIKGNEGADRLAAEGACKAPDHNEIDLRIPVGTMDAGAELARTSQSLIYQHLTTRGSINRAATRRTIEKVKAATEEFFGETPTEEAMWRSMRHRDITKKIRNFLWKHAHGVYRLGRFWSHIPGCEDRGVCPLCGKQETIEHLLTECDATERQTIWDQTNALWRRRYDDDIPTTEGAVLGGGLANFKKMDGKPDAAKNRLYRILITEAAHLIWVLRCERRIASSDSPEGYHTVEAVRNRWYRKINERMQVDCLLTNDYLYGRKAQKTRKVYDTWAKCSTNTEDLHRDWCRHPGVLVGTTSRRPPGRHR